MAYLLDANVLIRAKNDYLAFDIAPAFWTWLDGAAAAGKVLSVDAVWSELEPQDDDLATWVRTRRSMFLPVDGDVIAKMQQVNSWAQQERQYSPAAKLDFAQRADSALIAHALTGGHTVVTHETPGPQTKSRIKIPTAAGHLGVECISPFVMLRRLRLRLEPAVAGEL